jgi:hypothetical protein
MIELWDWRRRVAQLYAEARASDDPEAAWQQWRAGRDNLFGDHPQSPLAAAARPSFTGIRYFDYDSAYRLHVKLNPVDGTPEVLDAGDDGAVSLIPFAVTRGLRRRLGGELTLYWIGSYGGGALVPFRDATSGDTTYGGGRYLLDTVKGADLGCASDGQTVFDFNYAYNPSCAYSRHWVCPLAPSDNHLPAAIEAGELTPP